MLPTFPLMYIGQSTQERAAVHEAAHAILVWLFGGQVDAIQVGYEDATRQWQGCTIADPLPNHSEQVTMLLAGGFAEARYLANVYDSIDWLIDEAVTRPAVVAGFGPPISPQVTVTYTDPNQVAPAKTVEVDIDIFSNDYHKATALAVQHGLNMNALVTSAIQKINDQTCWTEIIRLANRFLLCPPRILLWQLGPDKQGLVDAVLRPQYLIAHAEKKAKEGLKAKK